MYGDPSSESEYKQNPPDNNEFHEGWRTTAEGNKERTTPVTQGDQSHRSDAMGAKMVEVPGFTGGYEVIHNIRHCGHVDWRFPWDPPPPDSGGATPTPPDGGGGTPTPPDNPVGPESGDDNEGIPPGIGLRWIG